jgi:hypothetical protein
MEQGDHSGCMVELLACPLHMDEQLRRMGYEPGTSNMPHRGDDAEATMFTDEDRERTVGFCLWCGNDLHSMEEVEAHNADDMAACPVFQELHGEHCMPPVLQVMLDDCELPGERAEDDSEESEV